MVVQKTSLYKVLVVVLVFICWIQSSVRVEAAPLEHVVAKLHRITNEYDQVETYCYGTSSPEKIHALCYTDNAGSTNYTFVLYSYEKIDLYNGLNITQYFNDGSVVNVSDQYTASSPLSITLDDGTVVYYISYQKFNAASSATMKKEIELFCDLYYYSNDSTYNALKYLLNNAEPDVPYYGDYEPNWPDGTYDKLLFLENFKASIDGEDLVLTWDPVDYPHGERELMFIRFRLKQRIRGTTESDDDARQIIPKEYYVQFKHYGGIIKLEDLDMPDGYILSSVTAIPYYHLADNIEYPLKYGNPSYVYFDDDGNSTAPIVIDPAIDPDVEEEKVPRTILGTIQNFFGNFWRNITNTAKEIVVPNSADLLGLLEDMNDWFSDRFGFIWYPFDLAIDIVAAFGLGEPDTTLTVPALTINIMGGIKLWDSFEIDLDPVGFLQYVRFFTSVLMCCGTVSLAIRKWEEWIGGKNQ